MTLPIISALPCFSLTGTAIFMAMNMPQGRFNRCTPMASATEALRRAADDRLHATTIDVPAARP